MSLEVRIEKGFGGAYRLEAEFACGGGRLGVLGPSGSGKSMILKCIAGIETPDRGHIAVNGRVLFDSEQGINLPPQQRRVGILFQSYALFPNMTVEQNIGLATAGRRPERARRVGELAARFELGGLEKRFPNQLSGGQQQRTALARMLAAEPEVILLDEPFSALDAHLREQMQLRVLDAVKDCPDVVMVTHNRDEAFRMCGELLVLDDGRVLRHGSTREVYADPRGYRVAKVTGCKNISRMERLGGRTLRALDWGLTLSSDRMIPEQAQFVGIRAHDLEPAENGGGNGDNTVAMRIVGRVEDLFEWNVLFTNTEAASDSERGEIWWKYSKYAATDIPRRLRMPARALVFLEDDR